MRRSRVRDGRSKVSEEREEGRSEMWWKEGRDVFLRSEKELVWWFPFREALRLDP